MGPYHVMMNENFLPPLTQRPATNKLDNTPAISAIFPWSRRGLYYGELYFDLTPTNVTDDFIWAIYYCDVTKGYQTTQAIAGSTITNLNAQDKLVIPLGFMAPDIRLSIVSAGATTDWTVISDFRAWKNGYGGPNNN